MRASFKANILFLLLHTIFIIIISNIIYLSCEISDFQWAVTQHNYRKEGVAFVVIVVNCDHVERSSIDCRKTKTEVITTANQKKENYLKGPMRTQSKTNQTRGNTRITKSSSVLVLNLIGRESCVSFLDQLRSQVKPKQTNPGFLSTLCSTENCSNRLLDSY